jgi:ubiquinone/menaquinone biosynthesis C-methylase UbiE
MNTKERDFDKDAPLWDENAGRVRMANNIADAIIRSIPVNHTTRVLDFGCGTGMITQRIQPLVQFITGVDRSGGMLAVLENKVSALRLTNVMLQQVDIEQGQVLSGRYDLVICSMTMHHVKKPGSLLQQFSQVLVKGGYIGLADLEPDQGLFHGDNQGVFHFGFSRGQMSQMLTEAGFINLSFKDVTTIPRFVPGGIREFKIFLVWAQKA